MNLQTFNRGGIHPPDGKALAKDKPIQILMPKEGSLLVYPMSQHIGAPCEPIVAKGDRVLVGQKIAEAGGFVSAPIHASVSGTVKDIKPWLLQAVLWLNPLSLKTMVYTRKTHLLAKTQITSLFQMKKSLKKLRKPVL